MDLKQETQTNGPRLGSGLSLEVNLGPLLCDRGTYCRMLKLLELGGVSISTLDVNRQYRLQLKLEDVGPRMYTLTTFSPIVDPDVGFTTYDELIERMFCEAPNLQVLCTECHTVRTDDEKARAKARRARDKGNDIDDL